MSETTSDIIDVKCLEQGTTITIEVPAELHYRLQNLLYVGMPMENNADLHKFFENVKKDDSTDSTAFHARTLFWLLGTIEEAAEKQNKIVIKKINKTTGKLINED